MKNQYYNGYFRKKILYIHQKTLDKRIDCVCNGAVHRHFVSGQFFPKYN